MKKRFLSLLMALCLMLTLAPAAFAADGEYVAVYEKGNDAQNYTASDLSGVWFDGGTLRLLSDATVELSVSDDGAALGCMTGNTIVDLNGHTLTFTLPASTNTDSIILLAGLYASKSTVTVKNGTIVMDASATSAMSSYAEYGLGAYAILMCDDGGNDVELENVEIITTENNSLTAAISLQPSYYQSIPTVVTLKNCTVDVGEESPSVGANNGSGSVTVVSGSYKNLTTNGSSGTTVNVSGTKLDTNPEGVDAGTTVITSTDTTAMIVENGKAYLYDTLQEAVTAVENGKGSDEGTPATITLLKDTTGAVTLKTDTKFNISKADDITNGATYKTEDGYEVNIDDSGNVSVEPVAVTGVTLSSPTLELTVGGEAGNLTAAVAPETASQNVTWSSDNEDVATVSDGVVTAVAEGTATITATSAVDSSKTATCTVNVSKEPVPATNITLNKTSVTLYSNTTPNTVTLTATVTPEDSTDTVTWESENTNVATVDVNGTVTAVSAGTAIITAKAGSSSATCTVTVENPDKITINESTPADKTVTRGQISESDTLSVTAETTTDETLSYQWYNCADGSGTSATLIEGATGSVYVIPSTLDSDSDADSNTYYYFCKVKTATISEVSSRVATVTVRKAPVVHVEKVELNKSTLSLRVNDTETLIATVSPDNADDKAVTWTSSNTSVATVDESGTVRAVGAGTATITATADGQSAACEVTVTKNSTGSGGGGSSSTTYAVSTPSSVRNGTVSVSPKNASKGTAVTVTIKPDSGYELDGLTVTDANGNTVKLTRKSDTQYTFTMPAGKVTVEASFTEIEEQPDVPDIAFTDVPASAYYYDAVAWAVENGVTSGTTATTFSPNAACTRAQAVTFLWRAAGSPAPKSSVNPFADVSTSAYYYDAVLWAVEQGITAGTSAAAFSPDTTCTRAQIVTFLHRADGTAATGSNPFTDVADSAYYANAVKWAVENGVTAGTSASTFSPNAACTRGQIVTFLYRACA